MREDARFSMCAPECCINSISISVLLWRHHPFGILQLVVFSVPYGWQDLIAFSHLLDCAKIERIPLPVKIHSKNVPRRSSRVVMTLQLSLQMGATHHVRQYSMEMRRCWKGAQSTRSALNPLIYINATLTDLMLFPSSSHPHAHPVFPKDTGNP